MSSKRIRFEFASGHDLDGFSEENLSDWLLNVSREEGRQIDILCYFFCNDEDLLEINKKYLDHDTYTDIITFPYSYEPIQSDIYISLDRVIENAARYSENQSFQEFLRVVCHGLLHLCGYEDVTDQDKAEMRALESRYIQQYIDRYSDE